MKKLLILFIMVSTLSALADDRKLTMYKNGEAVTEHKFEDLLKNLQVHKISAYNFALRTTEDFDAFSMKDILNLTYKNWKDAFSVDVIAKDGYRPIVEVYKYIERGAFLAFRKSNGAPFTRIIQYKEKLANLGPFYLIWKEDKKKVPSRRRIHWAYKVVGLDLRPQIAKVLVPKKGVDESIVWGFKNTYKNCLACHSIHGAGSKKSGELISNGVVKKYSEKDLAKLIHNPRSINPKSNMPRFSPKIDLRTKRIKDIVSYLKYLEKEFKVKKSIKRESKTKKLNKSLDSQL